MMTFEDPAQADQRKQAQARLDALSPQQRQRLLELAKAKRQPAAAGPAANLHSRFEEWAQRSPNAIAVSEPGRGLSYAELDTLATALARRLLDAGLQRGELVAITLDRSIEVVVAILAVLKAGGAYLPIDPAVPEERQRFIRTDAAARFTLTASKYAALLSGYDGRVFLLDQADQDPAGKDACGAGVLLPAVTGTDLAYVIYTSGSTGKPKGVMVEHRHVARLFTSAEQHFSFSSQDVWTLFHSYAFDFSVWEIWGALLYGARLVIVPHDVARAPSEFARLLIDEQVTVLNQTPTAFSNLIPELLACDSRGALRYVVFGGEALETRRLRGWFDRFGDQSPALVNMYGITETTVHVTYKLLSAQDAIDGLNDIGTPLADLTLHVLNERRKPVPPGVTGELYVGGAGVTRGYLNRPELTAERFVAHPSLPGEVLYRTGDLARRLDNGALAYMGRNDGQVKLRGFRIELGDIERQMVAHPAVEAAVVVLAGEDDTRQLVAYLVLAGDAGPDWKQELYRHLSAAVPDYMIPGSVVALERLPLTENGKVDRRALPAPAGNDVWQRAYVAPKTPAEQLLCGLIAGLLQVDRVGIDDNFFGLGGDSIRAVNLVALARDAGLNLSIADVFANPCVADLARVSASAAPQTAAATGPFDLISPADRALLPADVEAACPMSRLQQGMIYENLASADNSAYHNVINQRYRGELDFERMRLALGNVMSRHEILRTSFHLDGYSEPLQLIHRSAPAPLHVTDLRGEDAAAQDAHVEAELVRLRGKRIDLKAAPLFQAHVYRIADAEFELIWLEHHAILDGWSLASFMTQLVKEYIMLAGGQPVRAAVPLSSSYRDFIACERRAIADPDQETYWAAYLAGATPTILPAAQPRTETGARQIAPFDIPADQFAACRALARAVGVPLKSLFLAAYAKVMSKFSGEIELLVGLTTHGRPETRDSDDLLGLYVSQHPLRLSCGQPSWRELILHCYRAEAEIWPRRFYPMSEIKQKQGALAQPETTFTYNHFSVTEDAHDIGMRGTRARASFEFNEIGLGVTFVVRDMQANFGQINVAFDGTRFDDRFALRIQQYLHETLVAMLAGVDATADVLSEADAQIAAALAQGRKLVEAHETLVGQFQGLLASHAGGCAVQLGDRALSFGELDDQSARIAAVLRRRGVGRGDLVGFATSPSPDMAATVVAVLKLGAVVLALDPEQTAARLRDIIDESRVVHIVADPGHRSTLLPAGLTVHALPALALEARATDETAEPIDALAACDPAYVIYTSGSTGRPKGVTINHGNALAYLRGSVQRFALAPGERLLQVSNTGFDIFLMELLYTLFNAGTLVLRTSPLLPDGPQLWELVDRERITILCLATAYLHLLCDELPPDLHDGAGDSLRLVLVGGEAMQRRHVDRWLERWGNRNAVVNIYGPTEVTVAATTFDTRTLVDLPQCHTGVPLGRPLAHASFYILGKDLRSLPQGVAGELYIGGGGVSLGYMHRPELTAERFLPVGSVPGVHEPLYRTGDLLRTLEDGQVEFVARADTQLKIRGYRVEVDEVRHAICAHAEVKHCAVVPMRDADGERKVVAYVVLHETARGDALAAIKSDLRDRLPGYMQPSAWMSLAALPLTPNRKVDVRALPAPDFHAVEAYVAPASDLETEIQKIWCEVLARDEISVVADFFALGGHSLLLTRLLLRIGKICDVELSLAELMRGRTVRDMAALVAATRSIGKASASEASEDSVELEW
jgi:amino acid adenylation domain-containing protein